MWVLALHFNENCRRHQAVTKEGTVAAELPKRKEGWTCSCQATQHTYNLWLCGHLAAESYRMQTTDINDGKASLGYQPPPLTSAYAAVNKDQLVATRCTRFAKYSLWSQMAFLKASVVFWGECPPNGCQNTCWQTPFHFLDSAWSRGQISQKRCVDKSCK